MNIQIFGTKKCRDTQKAERWFKERTIKFQFIDLKEKEMSPGEFDSVVRAVGGVENLINKNSKDFSSIAYLTDDAIANKLFEKQVQLLVTPIVRNGKQATSGLQPDVWKNWE